MYYYKQVHLYLPMPQQHMEQVKYMLQVKYALFNRNRQQEKTVTFRLKNKLLPVDCYYETALINISEGKSPSGFLSSKSCNIKRTTTPSSEF